MPACICKEGAYVSFMYATSTITSKNQTTLPKAVVRALGVKPADKLLYEIEDNRVVVRARSGRLADMVREPPAGPVPKRRPGPKDIDAAGGRHLAQDELRIRRDARVAGERA